MMRIETEAQKRAKKPAKAAKESEKAVRDKNPNEKPLDDDTAPRGSAGLQEDDHKGPHERRKLKPTPDKHRQSGSGMSSEKPLRFLRGNLAQVHGHELQRPEYDPHM